MNEEYKKLDCKIPKESQDYEDCSDFVVRIAKTTGYAGGL
jgi:hypothetical protein